VSARKNNIKQRNKKIVTNKFDGNFFSVEREHSSSIIYKMAVLGVIIKKNIYENYLPVAKNKMVRGM
jgi:hypothetical protein